ncbi:MAG: site-2 protease family protein [Patescibacteria group bacterium]|jgi:Zn-dependent protease
MLINLLFSQPILFFIGIVAIVYAITIHEFSHALAGKLEGDRTAESLGRLTLNPLSHLDPWGFLLMLFIGFGWGRPVPFNPTFIKHRRWGPALISLAGPISNLLSAVFFGLILKVISITGVLPSTNYLVIFLEWLILLNTILAVFNLIPIPPLDGSKLLFSALPRTSKALRFQIYLEHYGPMIVIGLVLIDSFSSGHSILGSLFNWIQYALFTIFT